MFKLDLSKFKKISSDEHSTALRHPEGHTITIEHKALNPSVKKQLHALPMAVTNKEEHPKKIGLANGTPDVQPVQQDPTKGSAEYSGLENNSNQDKRAKAASSMSNNFAQGGQIGDVIGKENYQKRSKKDVPHFAEGTPDVQPVDDSIGMSAAAPAQPPAPAPDSYNPQVDPTETADDRAAKAAAAGPARYIGNAMRQAVMDTVQTAKSIGAPIASAKDEFMKGLSGIDPDAQQQAPQQQRAPASDQPPPPQDQPPEDQDPYGIEAQNKTMMGGFNQQEAGNTAEAKATGQLGANQAQIYHQNAQNQQDLMDTYADHVAGLTQEYNDFRDDIKNSQIDPKHYMNNMSTFDTIRTGIGIILGGAGGGENQVLKMVQGRIEQDIDAQKANLGKKESLLSANMRQFGNLRDATDMTRLMMNGAAANEINEQASKSASPLAAAKAQQLNGLIEQQKGPIIGQMAMRKTLMSQLAQKNGNSQQDPSQRIRLLAMTGIIPPAKEAEYQTQLKQAQDAQSLKDNTLAAYDKIAQLQTLSSRAGSPVQSSQQIAGLQGAALDKLTKDTSGRVTPETVKLIGSSFPGLTSNAQTVAVNRRVIQGLLTNGMHYPMLRSVGINQFDAPNMNVLKSAEKPPIRRGQ
jgi:hypothetical protein